MNPHGFKADLIPYIWPLPHHQHWKIGGAGGGVFAPPCPPCPPCPPFSYPSVYVCVWEVKGCVSVEGEGRRVERDEYIHGSSDVWEGEGRGEVAWGVGDSYDVVGVKRLVVSYRVQELQFIIHCNSSATLIFKCHLNWAPKFIFSSNAHLQKLLGFFLTPSGSTKSRSAFLQTGLLLLTNSNLNLNF